MSQYIKAPKARLTTVAEFPKNYFLENLAVRSDNSILITETGNALTTTATGINLPELYPNAVQNNYIPAVTFNGTRISASPSLGTGDAPFVNYNTTIDTVDNLTKRGHIVETGPAWSEGRLTAASKVAG